MTAASCVLLSLHSPGQELPGLCAAAGPHGCEEAALSRVAAGTLAAAALWTALWAIPWWYGLRRLRVGVALAAFLALLAGPARVAAGW